MFGWLRQLFQASRKKAPAHGALPGGRAAVTTPEAAPGIPREQRDVVNSGFFRWSFETRDGIGSRVYPLEKKILEALEQLVKSNHPAEDLVRRMPGVVPQLMHILKTDNFSGSDLSRKISHDVVLVQAVLRLANSSLYNPSKAITSIGHAVPIIGQGGLRQLISSVIFRPIINLNFGRYTRLAASNVWMPIRTVRHRLPHPGA